MKHLFLLLLFFNFTKVNAQIIGNCNVPIVLKNAYEDDVNYLAIQRLYQNNHADTNKIIVPSIHTDSIWSGLAAVFNLNNLLDADSVFKYYCIHEYNISKSIIVGYDTNIVWLKNWMQGNINTGNTSLDSFINYCGFTTLQVNNNDVRYVILQTNQVLNFNALQDSFKKYQGIKVVGKNNIMGDGNHINYTIANGYQKYKFTLAWGDCPVSCTWSKTWEYGVNNCEVSLLSINSILSTMPTIDKPIMLKCLLGLGMQTMLNPYQNIKIYPNPANDILNLEIENINVKSYTIYNTTAQKISSNKLINNKINVANLCSGIYILEILNNNNQKFYYQFTKN